MDVALLVVRAVLAAVFAVAGAAKLADRPGSTRAAGEFGVPRSLAPAVGLGLPLVELSVAALLLPAATAVWGAVGAAALLAAFVVAIARSVAQGRAPDCHCFGQLHSEPAGWPTLFRNLVLGAGAVFVVAAGWSDPGTSAVAWLGRLDGAGIGATAAGAIAAFAAILSLNLLQANRALARRLDRVEHDAPAHGLPLQAPAPKVKLRDLEGTRRTLGELLVPERLALLVFVDPSCVPCETVLPSIGKWQRERSDEVTAIVISSGSVDDVRVKALAHGLQTVLVDRGRKAYRAFDANGTPSAVLVTPAGRIDSETVTGARDIYALVDDRLDIATPGGLAVGSEAPDLTLRELDGGEVELASFRGRETLFLFWDPAADECRALRGELAEWEASGPEEPVLVLIGRAEPDALAAEGFRSRVLLDTDDEAAYVLGGFEPPVAVLIGADGRVAWPLAAGEEHILRLLRSSARAAAPAGIV